MMVGPPSSAEGDSMIGRPASSRRLLLATVVFCAGGSVPGVAADPVRSPQELMAERGLVRYRGAWRTVQEIEIIEAGERADAARREWKEKLERLRRAIGQPATADRAIEEIREIADPAAVAALGEALAGERDQRVRSLYVEALSHIRAADAVGVLVTAAIDHPDAVTRADACDRLVVIGPRLAGPPLVAALSGGDNARINRAAEALGRLGLAEAVGPLIDALQTEHVAVVNDGGGPGSTSVTFTPGGGGGLSAGGGPKRVKGTLRNDAVLAALVTLTGANFEWDEAAWKAWRASREAPPADYDPRRGLP